MAEKVLLIALSPTMEEGTIVRWNKKEGDEVKPGDLLCEVETDKATMDYESAQTGTLLAVIAKDGTTCRVGDAIAVIGKPGEKFDELLVSGARDEREKKEDPQPLAAKESGGGQTPQPPVPEKSAGEKEASAQTKAAPPQESRPQAVQSEGERIKASPLARKQAAFRGIPLAAVKGTGPGGRIVLRDLAAGVRTDLGEISAHSAVGRSAEGMVPGAVPGDTVIQVSGKRAVIAKRLSESAFTAPHYFLRAAVGMDTLLAARQALNEERAKAGLPKVSLNAFFIKLAAESLKRHPEVNASFRGDTIIRFGSVDIGLAVALDDGLITPVVRNALGKGILAIDEELSVLIAKARGKGLSPEEYSSATFSISNLGSYGIEEFTAIINPPGSAILALGEVKREAVVCEDGSIGVRQMMRMTLSCDHRIIDGAVGAAFLHELALIIEHPERALY